MTVQSLDDLVATGGAGAEIPATHAVVHDRWPTAGFEASPCEGRMRLIWRRLDRRTGDEAHLVELYACGKCDRRISVDVTAGVILNSYAHQGAPSC